MLRQESDPVQPGERVRVKTLHGPDWLIGVYAASDSLNLRIRLGERDRELALLRQNIFALQVSRGKSGNGRSGAFLGLLVGAGIGAVVGAANGDAYVGFGKPGKDAWVAMGFAAGAVAGLLAGIVIGSSIKTERWEAVNYRQPRR